jgi:hypothetical protein
MRVIVPALLGLWQLRVRRVLMDLHCLRSSHLSRLECQDRHPAALWVHLVCAYRARKSARQAADRGGLATAAEQPQLPMISCCLVYPKSKVHLLRAVGSNK